MTQIKQPADLAQPKRVRARACAILFQDLRGFVWAYAGVFRQRSLRITRCGLCHGGCWRRVETCAARGSMHDSATGQTWPGTHRI